jgi:D-hexose-6-phosphate mutarotase
MSDKSLYEPGRPIRGGIPICFPWFGARAGHPGAPGHGIARLETWALESVRAESDCRLTAVLRLDRRAGAPLAPDFAFDLHLTVSVGATLDVELLAHNSAATPAVFEEALHTYYAVSDVRQIRITGLEGLPFLDKVQNLAEQPPSPDAIAVTAETDRVYLGTSAPVTIHDPGWARRILVEKRGSATTVVWNPWVAKAAAMPDFGKDEWTGMVCIEAANARENAVTVRPGATHALATRISVAPA